MKTSIRETYEMVVISVEVVSGERFKQPHHWKLNGDMSFYMTSANRDRLSDKVEVGDTVVIQVLNWQLDDRSGTKNYIIDIK